jgi:hypothetical protein
LRSTFCQGEDRNKLRPPGLNHKHKSVPLNELPRISDHSNDLWSIHIFEIGEKKIDKIQVVTQTSIERALS